MEFETKQKKKTLENKITQHIINEQLNHFIDTNIQ